MNLIASFMEIESNTFLRSDPITASSCVGIISKIKKISDQFTITKFCEYPGDEFSFIIEIYWDHDWIGVDVLSKISRRKFYHFSFDPSVHRNLLNKLSQLINLKLISSDDPIEVKTTFDDICGFISQKKNI